MFQEAQIMLLLILLGINQHTQTVRPKHVFPLCVKHYNEFEEYIAAGFNGKQTQAIR